MHQTTIDEEIDRQAHIARLTRSLARWRETGLDTRIPDEYARFCEQLAYLQAGGAYTVRRFDPMELLNTPHKERGDTPIGAMVRDIGAGFAAASRASIRPSRARKG